MGKRAPGEQIWGVSKIKRWQVPGVSTDGYGVQPGTPAPPTHLLEWSPLAKADS